MRRVSRARSDLLLLRCDVLDGDAPTKLPDGYEISWWFPSGLHTQPRGIDASWRFLAWRLLCADGISERRYGVVLVTDSSGRVAHSAVFTPRYFQYPFAGERDVMIGSLFTDPEHRGRGLASAAVSAVVSHLSNTRTARAWYVVSADNAPSIRVAERNGFRLVGRGIQGTVLRTYRVGHDHASDRTHFDYASVTEDWDTPANLEQRQMAELRYRVTSEQIAGRRYLEVACGTGFGFALSKQTAAFAAAGDIMMSNLNRARFHLGPSPLVRFHAGALPFCGDSFDVLACLEAIYYFPSVDEFLSDAVHVLRPSGKLIISWPNAARPGFHPSPGSTRYPTISVLRRKLEQFGFTARAFGAFPWQPQGPLDALRETLRRAASRLGLVPTTLTGRARVKRIFYRRMASVSDWRTPVAFPQGFQELEDHPSVDEAAFKLFMMIAEHR